MSARIADRLATVRRQRMIGREQEIALFRQTLEEEEPAFLVLHVSGPGGVGKTTLLRAFAALCDDKALWLDGRTFPASPDAFQQALREALDIGDAQSPLETLADAASGRVLFVDTYEEIEALDDWLRRAFLPRLSADTLVVFASRNPLPLAWRADAGWQSLTRPLQLPRFRPEESRAYLAMRAVPAEYHDIAVNWTHGLPFALSLISDVWAQNNDGSISLNFAASPETLPDVVPALLKRLVKKAPSAAHRTALEICALVRETDEALLSETLTAEELRAANANAHDVFNWLRALSFIESGGNGVYPHDIARAALLADLRWRDRTRYVELHRRARALYAERLPQATGREQQRLLYDCIFLHRDSPVVQTAFTWQDRGVFPDSLRGEGDADAVIEMVRRNEGESAATIARHWLLRQPEATTVFRPQDSGAPPSAAAGFAMLLYIENITDEDEEADPGAEAALRYLRTKTPLRPGETATFLRFWMARDTYQNPSSIQSMIVVHLFRHYISQARPPVTLFAFRDPDLWEQVMAYLEIPRLREADFSVDGLSYGMYGIDWRTLPLAEWLNILAEKEVGNDGFVDPAPPREPTITVLSESDFKESVLSLLRNFTNAEEIKKNPLLRSRIVVERAGHAATVEERAAALLKLVQQTAESLQTPPRAARGYRAVYQTYLHPAPTQERAAEILDLPFNTYRHHLAAGIADLTRLLWRLEIAPAKSA